MKDITVDSGLAIFIGMELDKTRQAVKEDLKRYDLSPATRLELHKKEDALNLVISLIGANRPNKQGRELGYPQYILVAEWEDDSINVYVENDETVDDAIDELEESEAKVKVYKGILKTDEVNTIHVSPPQGTPEMVEERKRHVAARNKQIAAGEYKTKQGNAPKFVLERE